MERNEEENGLVRTRRSLEVRRRLYPFQRSCALESATINAGPHLVTVRGGSLEDTTLDSQLTGLVIRHQFYMLVWDGQNTRQSV